MSKLTEQLSALIRPIVKQELKALSKLLAPIIKEEVEKGVNKILAEQFVRGMSSHTERSLGHVFAETTSRPTQESKPIQKPEAKDQKRLIRERFEEKLSNLNIPKEEWHLFENLPSGPLSATGTGGGGDDDDEGVDLSKLGL